MSEFPKDVETMFIIRCVTNGTFYHTTIGSHDYWVSLADQSYRFLTVRDAMEVVDNLVELKGNPTTKEDFEILERKTETILRRIEEVIPQTPTAKYGVPYYEVGDVPSPWIPFVVFYRVHRWWKGWEDKSQFVQCLTAAEAKAAVTKKEPKAQIKSVVSMKYNLEHHNLRWTGRPMTSFITRNRGDS